MKKKLENFLALLVFLAACFLVGKYIDMDFHVLQKFLHGPSLVVSGAVYIVLYVVLTFFIWFGPKDVLRVSGALIFGAGASTILVWICETINAYILFQLSRKMGREYIESKFHLKPAQMDTIQDDTSFVGTFAIRINPLIPFRLMDLGAGLSRISLRKYLTIVILASVPRIFWLQWILADFGKNLFKEMDILMPFLESRPDIILYSLFYFLTVIGLTLSAGVLKMLRKRPNKKGPSA